MRVYKEEVGNELISVVCNCCGRKLLPENGILKKEYIHVSHDFGFFSERDGETHSFDLCEDCYVDIVSKFRVPADIQERKELL